MYNQSVASGPSLVSDIYGLPLVRPGCRVPTWIKRRRRYLKKLSPAARNTLLTGDPFFAFDNTAYDSEWTSSLPTAPIVARAGPMPPGPAPIPTPADVVLPPVPPVLLTPSLLSYLLLSCRLAHPYVQALNPPFLTTITTKS